MKDYGNLTFEDIEDEPVGGVKHVRAVGRANQRLSEAVRDIKMDGRVSVMLGGDHRCAADVQGSEILNVSMLPHFSVTSRVTKATSQSVKHPFRRSTESIND